LQLHDASHDRVQFARDSPASQKEQLFAIGAIERFGVERPEKLGIVLIAEPRLSARSGPA
jgi:hypothetical protein